MAKEKTATNMTLKEVLDLVAAAPSRVEKSKLLLKYDSKALRNLLKAAFDDSIVFKMPKGSPPYEKADLRVVSNAAVQRATKQMGYFVEGGLSPNMLQPKREKMFMNFLETMHPDDAELHIAAKDKKFSVPTPMFKGVTKKLVKETWPNLIKE